MVVTVVENPALVGFGLFEQKVNLHEVLYV